MPRQKQTIEETEQNVLGNLSWQVAERNDMAVAAAIHQKQPLAATHTLDEVGLLDGFFHFMTEVGVFGLLEEVKIPTIKRVLVPVIQFILLYMLRILFGVDSMNGLPELLFSNEGAMKLVGFNGYQIKKGMTKRGDAQRKEKKKQGPLSGQCLAQNICKVSLETVVDLFNGVIGLLAAFGIFAAEITVSVDGSLLPTTAKYEGCGCLKVTERRQTKQGEWVTVVELVYGWKLIALMDTRTRVPLAIAVVQIQAYEGEWIVSLVKQAQKNLGAYARIVKVVADRAYIDGDDLWQLHHELGVIFVVIAKSNMLVRKEAVTRAKQAKSQVNKRTRIVRHGHGAKQTTQERTTQLVAIEAMTSYGQYGDPEKTKHYRRKGYKAEPINAVVVLEWDGRQSNHVYLTNGPVSDPFVVFDDYDQRSLIENGLFRESKGPWNLLSAFPQRNKQGVLVHVFFTMTVLALVTAYRLWDKSQTMADSETQPSDEPLTYDLLTGEGAQRWRRRLKQENRDKMIVFVGDHYGIFHLAEFMVLASIPLREVPAHLGQPADILSRFGLES